MLTCLTHEDAIRLLRKVTQKGFFQRLIADLAVTPLQLVVDDPLHWHSISGSCHRLSRECSQQGVFSDWALWSDLQSMHPLLMAAWSWWLPLLQGAVTAMQMPRKQVLNLDQADTDLLWTLLAAVYTRGVDEIYLIGESAQQAWSPLLKPLPVVVQCVESIGREGDAISLQPVLPAHWYRLYALLNGLCQDLNTGHRVNIDQKKHLPEQYLNRLLSY